MAAYCDFKYPNVFSSYKDLKHKCLLHTDQRRGVTVLTAETKVPQVNDKDLKGSHTTYCTSQVHLVKKEIFTTMNEIISVSFSFDCHYLLSIPVP